MGGQDLLLVAVVAAAFTLGYFAVKRLDRVLDGGSREPDDCLRVGISGPTAAEGITGVLERYDRACPDAPVCLSSGAAESLLAELSANRLDVIFLPETGEIPAGVAGRRILLRQGTVVTEQGGVPVMPLTEGELPQRALWAEPVVKPAVRRFLEYLGEAFPEREE